MATGTRALQQDVQCIHRRWQGSLSGSGGQRKNEPPSSSLEGTSARAQSPSGVFHHNKWSGICRPVVSSWLSHCVGCDFLLNPSGAAVGNWIKPRV